MGRKGEWYPFSMHPNLQEKWIVSTKSQGNKKWEWEQNQSNESTMEFLNQTHKQHWKYSTWDKVASLWKYAVSFGVKRSTKKPQISKKMHLLVLDIWEKKSTPNQVADKLNHMDVSKWLEFSCS